MKHIKLFENFNNDKDNEILIQIISLFNELWFLNGEDAPEDDFIASIRDFGTETDNQFLIDAIELVTGGPGYSDVWIDQNILISELDDDVDMEEIRESNRRWFESERKELAEKCLKMLDLEALKRSNPLLFAKAIEVLETIPGNYKVTKKYRDENPDLFKGASVIKKFMS